MSGPHGDQAKEITRRRKENRILREEEGNPKKSNGLLCEPKMTRFSFIHAWRKTFAICRMCKVLQVTARGYRAWRCRSISQRQRDDVVLLAHIREQHKLSLQSCGRPRMTEEPQGLGFEVKYLK